MWGVGARGQWGNRLLLMRMAVERVRLGWKAIEVRILSRRGGELRCLGDGHSELGGHRVEIDRDGVR